MKKKMAAVLAAGFAVWFSAFGAKAAEPSASLEVRASMLVQGYEWGPGVPKVILELPTEAKEIQAENLQVSTVGKQRTVSGVYLCDELGNSAEGGSRYVAIDLLTTYDQSGSPFDYDRKVYMNVWKNSYPIMVACDTFAVDGEKYPILIQEDCIDRRICPDTERFAYRGIHTGTYRNAFSGEEDEIVLRTAAYEPEHASGQKLPLVIWLHGQGEGGRDVDIALLGNEVTALAREEIQNHFSTGEQRGAYVLAVQCETYWMDEGDGSNGQGSGVSRYTEALMETIDEYVKNTPGVDPDRMYLGGCSNGGYMTMNMLLQYPGYFAAAYPNCEAYSFYEHVRSSDGRSSRELTETRWFSEADAETLKETPIWFVLSVNDTVVNPETYTLPTYQALLQAGAENTWLSLFATVEGSDSPGTSYLGHFSWVYTLNDQVTGVQDRAAIRDAEPDAPHYGAAPNNTGGGSGTANGFANLFDWLNAQSNS